MRAPTRIKSRSHLKNAQVSWARHSGMAVSLRFIPGSTIRWRERRFVVVDYAGTDAIVAREVGKPGVQRIPGQRGSNGSDSWRSRHLDTDLASAPEDALADSRGAKPPSPFASFPLSVTALGWLKRSASFSLHKARLSVPVVRNRSSRDSDRQSCRGLCRARRCCSIALSRRQSGQFHR